MSSGDLDAKQRQIEELEHEFERMTIEHAKSTEQLNHEISRVVKESEEARQDMQARFDDAMTEKTNEFEKLEEQLELLHRSSAKEVCINTVSLKLVTLFRTFYHRPSSNFDLFDFYCEATSRVYGADVSPLHKSNNSNA